MLALATVSKFNVLEMKKLNYKKYFLKSFVVALSVSAFIGILVFLFGEFSELENRLLATTILFGIYSLVALCCASISDRKGLKIFSKIGMFTAIVGFLYSVLILWQVLVMEYKLKIFSILVVLAVGMAQISLLLLSKPKFQMTLKLRTITITLISVVSFMIIKSTLTEFQESEMFFRCLGAFVVLVVLGTVLMPILDLISKKNSISNNRIEG